MSEGVGPAAGISCFCDLGSKKPGSTWTIRLYHMQAPICIHTLCPSAASIMQVLQAPGRNGPLDEQGTGHADRDGLHVSTLLQLYIQTPFAWRSTYLFDTVVTCRLQEPCQIHQVR